MGVPKGVAPQKGVAGGRAVAAGVGEKPRGGEGVRAGGVGAGVWADAASGPQAAVTSVATINATGKVKTNRPSTGSAPGFTGGIGSLIYDRRPSDRRQ